MRAQFSFHTDRQSRLIEITMSGLFTLQDVEDFLAARAQAHAALACPPNQHVTLNDLRALKIQPQEIVAAFQDVLAQPQYLSRRLAFVTNPTLVRSQLNRALLTREGRCFDSVEEARTWLLAA